MLAVPLFYYISEESDLRWWYLHERVRTSSRTTEFVSRKVAVVSPTAAAKFGIKSTFPVVLSYENFYLFIAAPSDAN